MNHSSLQLFHTFELSMHLSSILKTCLPSMLFRSRLGRWLRCGCRYLLGSYMLTLAAVTEIQNIAAGREGYVKCASPARSALGEWSGISCCSLSLSASNYCSWSCLKEASGQAGWYHCHWSNYIAKDHLILTVVLCMYCILYIGRH